MEVRSPATSFPTLPGYGAPVTDFFAAAPAYDPPTFDSMQQRQVLVEDVDGLLNKKEVAYMSVYKVHG